MANTTTFDFTISFEKDESFFYPDATNFAEILFAIICVLFTMAISLKYQVGEGTKAYSKSFLGLALLAAVVVQYYQLWFAILKLPVDFQASANRWDCLRSSKGGKVSCLICLFNQMQ